METTKEKATHTPGPWHYTLADETSSGGVYANEKCVCDIIPKELQVAYDCEELEITHANARLIAQSPAMYEMCKLFEECMETIDGKDGYDASYELAKVREVLAKVEGG